MKKFMEGSCVQILDPNLAPSPRTNLATEKILELALQCLAPTRQSRPRMQRCAEILWNIRKDYRELLCSEPLQHQHSKDSQVWEDCQLVLCGICIKQTVCVCALKGLNCGKFCDYWFFFLIYYWFSKEWVFTFYIYMYAFILNIFAKLMGPVHIMTLKNTINLIKK